MLPRVRILNRHESRAALPTPALVLVERVDGRVGRLRHEAEIDCRIEHTLSLTLIPATSEKRGKEGREGGSHTMDSFTSIVPRPQQSRNPTPNVATLYNIAGLTKSEIKHECIQQARRVGDLEVAIERWAA